MNKYNYKEGIESCLRGRTLFVLVSLFLITVITAVHNDVQAQATGTITGKITDEDTGESLIGATVLVTGTDYATTTDLEGQFSLSIPAGDYSLIISYVSYKSQTQEISVSAGQTTEITADMESDLMSLEAVVVSGVSSKTAKAITPVAVQRVDAAGLNEKANYNTVNEMLTGKVAGVSIQRAGGGLGADARFVVRSGGGINGNGQPIIFIDGVRVSNSQLNGSGGGAGISSLVGLNPEDIANIEIIKGPAGSSSYGTGAANGVVLITTKRGASGKDWEINYKGTVGFNEMRTLKEEDFRNYEWMNDQFFRRGAIFKNNFNISGGSDDVKAYFSVDRNTEEGMTVNNSLEQTNVRLNLDFIPTKHLSFRTSSQYSDTEIAFPQRGRGDGEFGYLVFVPLPYENWFGLINPSFFEDTQFDLNYIQNFNGSVSSQYIPFADMTNGLENLVANATFGMSVLSNENRYLFKRTTEAVQGENNPGERRLSNSTTTNTTFTGDIAYSWDAGKFAGSSSAGVQLFGTRFHESNVAKTNFVTDLIGSINGTAVTEDEPTEAFDHFRSAGIFTSHNVSYDNKFFVNAAVRQDYASVLGALTSNIVYPSASAMVRFDNFDFLPEVFSLLKTRVAYGETGTLPGRLAGIPSLWSPQQAQYGVGLTVASLGNPNLEPERVKQWEFGLDGQIGNYGFELTYYIENATNSIVPRPNLPSSGQIFDSPSFNLGSVEGSGFETMLYANWGGRALGGWKLDLTLINSFQENTVTSMGGAGVQIVDGPGGGRQVYREGLPKGAFFSSVTYGGLFSDGTNVSEIETAPNFGEVVGVGELYGLEESNEDVFIGQNTPEYTGSISANISVHNFSLYAMAQYKTGFFVYNEQLIDQIFSGLDTDYFDGFGTNSFLFDRLSQQLGYGDFNTGAEVLTPGTAEYEEIANQYAALSVTNDANAIQPGDFIGIREVSLSYDFKGLARNSNIIEGLRVGAAVNNLYNWFRREASMQPVVTGDGRTINRWMSGYQGLDSENHAGSFSNSPSTGLQSATLPRGRTVTFFLAVKF